VHADVGNIIILTNYFTGFTETAKRKWEEAFMLVEKQMKQKVPSLPLKKVFRGKYNIGELENYRQEPEADYWDKWPKLSYKEAMQLKSDIDVGKLEHLAEETEFPYPDLLEVIIQDVQSGASIGVIQGSDVPTDSSNAPSAFVCGAQISDTICKMISDGFVMGPFSEDDLPYVENRFSGVMAKIKPNNTARMILNLSKGFPHSVNSGIDGSEFPTLMSSTTEFIRILFRCGKGAEMTKADWASAYKQIRVRSDEVWQQAFRWLGKVFYELCLIFGAISSPGIFDRLAKLVLYIALVQADMPARCVIQHLDDVCSASPAGSGRAARFFNNYREVCEVIGVKLATEVDPDKAFAPSTEGIVLGVCYDTVDFVWYLREDKLSIILNMVQDAIEDEEMTQRVVQSLNGKLVDIRCLVPNSKFYLANLIMDSHQTDDMESMVELGDWTRADLSWWKLVLPLCCRRTSLQDPDRRVRPSALKIYSDAAGGSIETLGNGVGMVIYPSTYVYVPHRTKVNVGCLAYDGKSLANKLSVWELVGPLLALVCVPDMLRGRQAVAYVDNAGSVVWYNKGWAKQCNLGNTIIRAIYLVATALNCDFWVEKIGRCSSVETEAADALSKCDYKRFVRNMPEAADSVPRMVPRALLQWMQDPRPDRELGDSILTEMSSYTELLGYSHK
jgi:hypothetical protein